MVEDWFRSRLDRVRNLTFDELGDLKLQARADAAAEFDLERSEYRDALVGAYSILYMDLLKWRSLGKPESAGSLTVREYLDDADDEVSELARGAVHTAAIALADLEGARPDDQTPS